MRCLRRIYAAVMRRASFLMASIFLLGTACGDDSSSEDTAANDSSGTTTSPATGTTSSPQTGDGSDTDETDSTPDTTTTGQDTDSADSTSSDSTGPAGECMVWEITYDLEGSEFEVSDTPLGAGDQVNVVTMPYDADDHVGPGSFVLRFQDVDGAPGGLAAMVSYDMEIQFAVDSGATLVETDLTTAAGPDECGVTTGMVEGTTVAWMPSAIVGRTSMGQILCTGAFCGVGGLPNGRPVPVDEVGDQPVSDFDFSEDFSTFTMLQTIIAQDDNSTTSWTYAGVETDRQLVAAPACLCP